MTATPLIPPDVARLVIHLPSWVGDAVMATPVLRAARAACPQARISGLMRRGIDDLLAGTPDLDELVPVDAPGLRGLRAAAGALRRMRPEAALILPNSFRSALAVRLGRVPVRIGYARDGRSWLLTHSVEWDRSRRPVPAVEYYAHLAERAFGRTIEDRSLRLATTDSERGEADRLLEGAHDPVIVINPGANRDDKRWPAERFAVVASRLARELSATIAVTGSPVESSLVRDVVRQCGGAIDLAARGITLRGLKAVLARAALLITNDTGPRHIAAAVGAPAVVLFGPTDHRWTTLPGVGARERALIAEPFLPESLVADDHKEVCAINRIPVSDVLAAARELLEQRTDFPHAPHTR